MFILLARILSENIEYITSVLSNNLNVGFIYCVVLTLAISLCYQIIFQTYLKNHERI
jgi:hypothetical protein